MKKQTKIKILIAIGIFILYQLLNLDQINQILILRN